jgi:CubicO group peptidase (beta-lactamase class C family)
MDYVAWVTHPEYDDGSAKRFVRSLSGKKLIANPGERFSYSNIAYNVLGDLLAHVLAKPFESAMQEQILIPSGMQNSTLMVADIPTNALAVPHLRSPEMRVNPVYPYQRADAPSSFLHTTVVDMCHWGITALSRGTYLGREILSSTGYDLMWTAVAARGNLRPNIYEEMGLGWTLGHFKNVKTVSHGGAGFGATAFLLILPEKNCAAIVLCNEESDAHFQAIQVVADTLIGQKPQANKVSWMVPISQALAEGGIDEAYARYGEIKARNGEFYCNESDLLNLSLQLFTAQKIEMAIDVLGLNIHVYPNYVESYLNRARLYLRQGDIGKAKESLIKALSLEPDNATATTLLEMVQHVT